MLLEADIKRTRIPGLPVPQQLCAVGLAFALSITRWAVLPVLFPLHSTSAGAQVVSLLATSMMASTLEDILALTVAGMASFTVLAHPPSSLLLPFRKFVCDVC